MSEFSTENIVLLFALCLLYLVWVRVCHSCRLSLSIVCFRQFRGYANGASSRNCLKAGGASGFYFAILALGFFKFLLSRRSRYVN